MQSANLGLLIKPRKLSSRKCKVGENAILGLLRTKNHEKYAFTLNIVLVTCGLVVRLGTCTTCPSGISPVCLPAMCASSWLSLNFKTGCLRISDFLNFNFSLWH